jgi:16S rRNA (cytidine1402-2'-O)-methyltransferase
MSDHATQTTGRLYLIPTTLDNLKPDARLSSLDSVIPPEVRLITSGLRHFVAENAKSARAYLKRIHATHPLQTPLQDLIIEELSVNTPAGDVAGLLKPLLAGHDCGLLSEAGVPAVADPGALLVKLAHEHHIRVCPLTGPSSLLLALMASGLNGQAFAFQGYLPTDAALRTVRIKQLEQQSRTQNMTQIFIETPYRNQALFDAMLQNCHADTRLCVAIDLTLSSEYISTSTIKTWQKLTAHNNVIDMQKRPAVFLLLAF